MMAPPIYFLLVFHNNKIVLNWLYNKLYFKSFAGCLNGGAQVRPQNNQPLKELTAMLEEMYRTLPRSQPDNNDVTLIYKEFLNNSDTDKVQQLLHTTYHAVEKMNTVLNIKW